MSGRGNWAILGLAKDSLETFQSSLEHRPLMAAVSQLGASASTRHIKVYAVGINPFSLPRLDDQHALDVESEQELARYAAFEPEARANATLPDDILNSESYAFGASHFELHDTLPLVWSLGCLEPMERSKRCRLGQRTAFVCGR